MKSRLLDISLHIFITLLVLHHQYPLLSQFNSLGQTDISHYSKYDYGGGTESWDIGLLENGHLLVANNDGLMIFNGMDWEIFKLPNRSITRSLEVSKSGRIYVGGQDEVGYFFPASNGTLVFHSIREQIPDQYLPLQDVWQILIDGSKVYFRSVNRIYIFDETESTFKVEDPNGTISCLGKIYDEIVYADIENGIQSLSESEAAWWEEANLEGLNISHILPWKDEIILVTEQNGLFVLGTEQAKSIQTPLNEKLKELAVFSVIKMSDDRLVFGTQFGGLIISDRDGSMISRFDSSTGLSKDDVRCIALDQQNNLWIGTSNGIDRIQMESPLRIIQPDAEQEEIFYDAVDFNGRLYLGSNVNLYSTSINNASSDLLASKYITYPQAKGQVWGLDKINDELILCHHEGAFQVSSEGIQKFSETNGVWKCMPANNPDEMYVGTYTGIDIYRKEDGNWVFLKKIEGFLESARILISTQKNEVWVSHPYRGVYKITHDNNYLVSSVKLYDEQKGLPSTLLNYIFKINNTPYVTAKKGIYRLDVLHDRFVLDSTLNKNISPDQNVRRLFQNTDGDIWFVAERECGLLSLQDDGQYEKRLFPILKDKFVGGFEKIFFLDNEHLLACTNENVLSVDLSQNVIRKRPTVFLDQVTNLALGDSVIFGGYSSDDNSLIFQQSSDMQYAFEPAENSFSFQFSSPQHDGRVAYRYQLAEEESDTSWTNWSSKGRK